MEISIFVTKQNERKGQEQSLTKSSVMEEERMEDEKQGG